LPCAGLELVVVSTAAEIVGREEHDCKTDVPVSDNLLKYSLPLVGLLMKDNRLEIYSLNKASYRFPSFRVVSMDDENLAGVLEASFNLRGQSFRFPQVV
jgi:hypothetical protein